MSLKSYLQALLNTRTTKRQASNATFPWIAESKLTTIPVETIDSTSDYNLLAEGNAPSDGWLTAIGNPVTGQINTLVVKSGWNEWFGTKAECGGSNSLIVHHPLSKGQKYVVTSSFLESATIYFLPTLGGED